MKLTTLGAAVLAMGFAMPATAHDYETIVFGTTIEAERGHRDCSNGYKDAAGHTAARHPKELKDDSSSSNKYTKFNAYQTLVRDYGHTTYGGLFTAKVYYRNRAFTGPFAFVFEVWDKKGKAILPAPFGLPIPGGSPNWAPVPGQLYPWASFASPSLAPSYNINVNPYSPWNPAKPPYISPMEYTYVPLQVWLPPGDFMFKVRVINPFFPYDQSTLLDVDYDKVTFDAPLIGTFLPPIPNFPCYDPNNCTQVPGPN